MLHLFRLIIKLKRDQNFLWKMKFIFVFREDLNFKIRSCLRTSAYMQPVVKLTRGYGKRFKYVDLDVTNTFINILLYQF